MKNNKNLTKFKVPIGVFAEEYEKASITFSEYATFTSYEDSPEKASQILLKRLLWNPSGIVVEYIPKAA